MRKKAEYSRYYGDFRGVDFSTDHTLVNPSRFPYLVNMYKDYAAGGGQGIETIPGFRRRFEAPNKGKIHGIHSYKLNDPDGTEKRHVLVHAGDRLYNWGTYPESSRDAFTVTATVKEYDEYSSDVEGDGVLTDYVHVKLDVGWEEGLTVDFRALRQLNGKWIGVYKSPVFKGEPKSAIYAPDAFDVRWTVQDEAEEPTSTLEIRMKKSYVDPDGGVHHFEPGDAVEICYGYLVDWDELGESYVFTYDQYRYREDELFPDETNRVTVTYTVDNIYSTDCLIAAYRMGNNNKLCTTHSLDSLPPDIRKSLPEGEKVERVVDYQGYPPITVRNEYGNTVVKLTLFRDHGIVRWYQMTSTGERISFDPEEPIVLTLYTAYASTTIRAATVVDLDEYEVFDAVDYLAADISDVGDRNIEKLETAQGVEITSDQYEKHGGTLLLDKKKLGGAVVAGSQITASFSRDVAEVIKISEDGESRELEMNDASSVSFVFGNKIYILDGRSYIAYDGRNVSRVTTDAYVPTTYVGIMPGEKNGDAGTEAEARNMLQPKFKNTFIPDGESVEYYMNDAPLDSVDEVKAYGDVLRAGTLTADGKVKDGDYAADLGKGKIVFATAPKKSEEVKMPGESELTYPEAYAGVEITASKAVYPSPDGEGEVSSGDFKSIIDTATVAAVFDNRVFLTGIKRYPNLIFWSNLKNPSYIGILNYVADGAGTTPITALLPVAGSLLALKGDTEQGGAAFYHTPAETGIDVMAKTYPSEEGLAGIGCLGAACNYLDDPVYVSRLGLEAIGQLSIRLERAREHRSSLIDAKLVNLPALKEAKMCEWAGYLALLVDGKIFLADSRQRYADQTGAVQYEWYYLEDIGVYEGQYTRYRYLTEYPGILTDTEGGRVPLKITYAGVEYDVGLLSDVTDLAQTLDVPEKTEVIYGSTEVLGGDGVKGIQFDFSVAMYERDGNYYACLCDTDGETVGGSFSPAVCIASIEEERGENLFFGTEGGIVCSFNFDKRSGDGTIPTKYYTFDNRTIYSGCAFVMDNCGVPHMNKSTVKKSTVIKVKSMAKMAAKVRVRTNRNPFNEIARVNASLFSFDDADFSDFSFVTGDDSLFAVKEKEKKWVEKQYYLYSDEYKKPFALYYLAYKYFIAGKYKG